MKKLLLLYSSIFLSLFTACESSEDISLATDHQVPDCTSLTLTADGKSVSINDASVTLLMWGLVPKTNLEVISLPTIEVSKGATLKVSFEAGDNVGLKTLNISYSPWLFSDYINFSNPSENIPLEPRSYTYSIDVQVPLTAVSSPWLEDYYYKDGTNLKIIQSYHKIELKLMDANMNTRIVPIYVKVKP